MSKTKIKIDIISDVVCPWCIIGYKRLEKALQTVSDKVEADIHWHPFELNPDMSEKGENLREHLATKYGTTLEGSIKARANLTNIGNELGFQFDYFDEMKMLNTFKAHQLLQFAKENGKYTELKIRLFSAFFGERKEINDIEVLTAEAVAVGLNEKEARKILVEERYASQVRSEESTWISRGVRSVPTFVFNNQYGVSGAQESASLVDVLLKL